MVFPRINRDKKEWAFGVFKNSEASTALSYGGACVWSCTSPDGNKVLIPTTALAGLFVGIVIEVDGIPAGDYGRVQTYGYCGSALVLQEQTTVSAAGNVLKPTNAQQYLTSTQAAGDGTGGLVYLAEAMGTITTAAASAKKVFVRAL